MRLGTLCMLALAVLDGQNIAHLTTAVFTAAFVPMKNQINALQKTAQS